MTNKRTKLQEDAHFRVRRFLQENPEMSERELDETVGVSVGAIHYVLNALIEKVLVKLGNFSAAEDERRDAYVLTPNGIVRRAALTNAFLSRKMEEYETLRKEIEALKNELPEYRYALALGCRSPRRIMRVHLPKRLFKRSTMKRDFHPGAQF